MLYDYVIDVMEVAFFFRLWGVELYGLLHGKCECFVMLILYVCVCPVAVLNAALFMACNLLMRVDDARGDHMEEATPQPVS